MGTNLTTGISLLYHFPNFSGYRMVMYTLSLIPARKFSSSSSNLVLISISYFVNSIAHARSLPPKFQHLRPFVATKRTRATNYLAWAQRGEVGSELCSGPITIHLNASATPPLSSSTHVLPCSHGLLSQDHVVHGMHESTVALTKFASSSFPRKVCI